MKPDRTALHPLPAGIAAVGEATPLGRGPVGPNGAGKATTLECLVGLRTPSEGTLRVRGIDPAREPGRLRDAIGVQLQTSGLPDTMRVDEAMRFFCAYRVALAARLFRWDRRAEGGRASPAWGLLVLAPYALGALLL